MCCRSPHALDLRFRLSKDTQNFCFQFPKFHGHHRSARMQDEINSIGQFMQMVTDSFTHAALDAIAFVSFAKYLARSEADARAGTSRGARLLLALLRRRTPGEEPGH
jgi:hypothetical protein